MNTEEVVGMGEKKEQRYGFVVFTGRHKILDYHKPDGQQIATADNEDAARTIVRALNASQAHERLLNVSLDLLSDVYNSRASQRFSAIGLSRIQSHIADLRKELPEKKI
jgi:hypothetical protein